MEKKGSIPRGEIIFAESVPLYVVPKWNANSFTKNYPFSIRVWRGQDPFYFCVATEQQRQDWINLLNNRKLEVKRSSTYPERGQSICCTKSKKAKEPETSNCILK